MDCLKKTDSHPTAEWVYEQLKPQYPSISLATVYRNLTQLKKAGLIGSVGSILGEERFDGTTVPHMHAVCAKCGKTVDLPKIQIPPDIMDQVKFVSGFQLQNTGLQFVGLCAECQKKE